MTVRWLGPIYPHISSPKLVKEFKQNFNFSKDLLQKISACYLWPVSLLYVPSYLPEVEYNLNRFSSRKAHHTDAAEA
jgi:hypothetical protein